MPVVLGGAGAGGGSGGSAALTYVTAAQLIAMCRWRLEDRPTEDQTAGTITSSATTLAVDTYSMFDQGVWFEWDDTSVEEAMCTAIPGSSPITIVRGHLGSTAAAHGDDVRILLRPRYPRYMLYQAILNAVAGLWPRVWTPVTQEVTLTTSASYYEANSDAEAVITGWQERVSTAEDVASYAPKGRLPDGRFANHNIELRRHQHTGQFTSGKAWYIPGADNTTNTLMVTYAAKPSITTVVEGLMADAVVAKAVASVALAKQFPRTSMDQSRGDQSTSPLDMARLAAQARSDAGSALTRLQAEYQDSYGFKVWRG